jgi:RES domain-containing protein
VRIPDNLPIGAVPDSLLGDGWKAFPAPPELADFGSRWVESMETAVLRVPSAVSPREFNFLLNPRHADFARLEVSRPEPFEFDQRLLGGLI